jgi:hypothetical protein
MAEVHTYIKGFDETIAAIKRTGLNVEQKHMDKATRAGIAVISRAIRTRAPVLGDGNKGLKTAVRGKVGKNKIKGVREAKAGLGVGVKPSKIKKQLRAGRSGVGISARNAHWFILGAGLKTPAKPRSKAYKRRETDKAGRYTKAGRYSGIMYPIPAADFVLRGFNASKEQASQKIHDILYLAVVKDFAK